MDKINADHWYIDENSLTIYLTDLHAHIKILYNGSCIYFLLEVTDRFMNKSTFNFYTLEDAISFTEKTVSTKKTAKDVEEAYHEQYHDFISLSNALKHTLKR